MPDAKLVRALHIPAAVLAHSSLSLLACAVLAEVLDLYRVQGNVFASDDHFAERCHVKPRTVRDTISELVELGFLIREVNYKTRHKRTLTPTDLWQNSSGVVAESATTSPEVVADSATTSGLVVAAESAGSSGRIRHDLWQNPPGVVADSANINTSLNTKANTTQTHTQKKEGECASKNDSLRLPAEESTAPNPVAPAHSPVLGTVNPCLEPGTEESRALAAEMAAYWLIPEGKNPRRWAQFATFTRTLAAHGRLAEVRTQFEAYRRYQQLRGLSRYSVANYLGRELEGYTDGEWCREWTQELAEAQQQYARKNNHGPVPAPVSAGGAPSQRKKDW